MLRRRKFLPAARYRRNQFISMPWLEEGDLLNMHAAAYRKVEVRRIRCAKSELHHQMQQLVRTLRLE